jgi:hypothetical protein
MPAGTKSLLGLGVTFCLMRPRPTNNINKTIAWFRKDVRRIAYFKKQTNKTPDENEGIQYTPSIYNKNDEWEPLKANEEIEKSLDNF